MTLPANNHNNANSQAWVFLVACVSGMLLFYPTLADMLNMWWEESSAYSHGLIMALIVAYFFLKQWGNDKTMLSIRPTIWMLPIILSLSMLWMVAYLSQIQALEQLVLLAVLISVVVALLGRVRAVPYIYIIALMIFTISSWSQINGFLRMATAVVSGNILDLTGVSSVREGFFILVPAGTFEVTNGCSGLRYQLAGLSISILYAYMEKLSLWLTLLYLLIAFIVIFLANVVRIVIVILAGQFTQMQSPLIDDHLWLGWVVFSVFISIFLYLSNRLIRSPDRDANRSSEPVSDNSESALSIKWGFTLVVLALTASGPILAQYYAPSTKVQKAAYRLDLPDKLNTWVLVSTSEENQAWKPDFVSPDVVAGGRYTDADRYTANSVDYYMMIYAYQTQGHEAVNINNRVYDQKIWTLTGSTKQKVKLASGWSVVVNEFEIRDRRGNTRLIWMWYYLDGENMAGKYKTKLMSLIGVFRQRPAISVNVLSIATHAELEPARRILTDFLNSGLQGMNALFDNWS